MTQALFFRASYERLQGQIHDVAPELDIIVYDENGKFIHNGREVSRDSVKPEYFWIHSELFFSSCLENYFQFILESPHATWLHTVNTGLDKLRYLEVINNGVSVTNNHSQAIAISEYVLAQVLACFQDIHSQKQRQNQKIWKWKKFTEIKGSRWLIIGFGHIGQNIAMRLKSFGAFVGTVRRLQETEGIADAVYTQAELKSALAVADVVVLTCASNQGTRNMVDADFLSRMKADSILVNIARGDLVVEKDLQEALDKGIPAQAILDVFNQEPPAQDSWVWSHPRVHLTPHCSNAGSGMRGRSDQLFLDNLSRVVKGESLLNLVSESDIV